MKLISVRKKIFLESSAVAGPGRQTAVFHEAHGLQPPLELRDGRQAEEPPQGRRLVEAGSNIYGIETEYPDLEDIYFSLTGKKKEGHS